MIIFRAISGKPSFFTKGKTVAFVGAKTAGNFKTTLSDPSSKVSFCNAEEKIAKNILSKPIEVSIT